MRIPALFFFLLSSFASFSQPLTDGMIFEQVDSSYYFRYDQGKFSFYNKDSTAIFEQQFDEFPARLNYDFYLGRAKDNYFVFQPVKKFIYPLDAKHKGLYIPQQVNVVRSSLSHDTLIRLKEFYFINLEGELVFEADAYSEMSDKNKKYIYITETDGMQLEGMLENTPENELDDYLKEQKRIWELENDFFKKESFDGIESAYDGFFEYSSTLTLSERFTVVRKGKKAGVVSSVGKYIIPPAYSYIEFVEEEFDYQPEGVPYLIKAFDGTTCHVYNERGVKLFESNYLQRDFSYLNPYEMGYDSYFNGLETRNKKKVGLIHRNGREILPPVYEHYDYFDFNRATYMNFSESPDKTASCDAYPFKQYFIGIDERKVRHFYAPNGQKLNSISLSYIDNYTKSGYFSFEYEGLYGLAKPGACILKKAEFSYIDLFPGSRDLFIVNTEENVYFIDGKGERLFGKNFDHAYFLDTTYAVVIDEGYSGLMQVKESATEIKWNIQPQYDNMISATVYKQLHPCFIVKKNNKVGIVDAYNKILVPLEFEKIEIYNSNFMTYKNGKRGLINTELDPLIDNRYDSLIQISYTLTWLGKKGGKWAFLEVGRSNSEQVKTAFEFEDYQTQSGTYDYYIVKKNGKWGVLNRQYVWFIEPNYEFIKYDSLSKEFECLKSDRQNDCYFVK